MATKGGSEDQKKKIAVAAFVVIAAGLFYFEYFDTSSSAPPTTTASVPVAPPRSAVTTDAAANGNGSKVSGARLVGKTSAGLDPTLHMNAMLVSESVVYSGVGRNIFSPNSVPPVVIPIPIAQARLKPGLVAQVAPPRPTGPPPPPPIDLKFFGFETSASGRRVAFLLHADSVITASAGDVVLRRYRIIAVDAKTIEVEDLQNNNKQTLPLLVN
jgi:hypothetical protein